MDQVIIYPKDNGIAVIFPTGDIPLNHVAMKDVPNGVPYRIIYKDQLPEDMRFFGAWRADFSEPDGHGIGAEAWHRQYAKEVLGDPNNPSANTGVSK